MKGVLEKSVVEWTKNEKPGQRARGGGVHSEVMRDTRTGRRGSNDEAVSALETGRGCEPKGDGKAGNVGLDGVTDRPVTAGGPDLEWSIETYGRPRGDGPQAITGLGQ